MIFSDITFLYEVLNKTLNNTSKSTYDLGMDRDDNEE